MENFITLQQFLKISGHIDSTGFSKIFLMENDVFVNGEIERRRGRKLFENDLIKIGEKEYRINVHQ